MSVIFFIYRAIISMLVILGFVSATPVAPVHEDDFVPVLRFAVASDVHMKDENTCIEYTRLQQLFDMTYAYAETQNYNKVDAFVFVGDTVNNNTDKQWTNVMDVVNDKLRDESEFIITYANSHDCSNDGTLERCAQKTGVEANKVWSINGFNFITVSQNESRQYLYANSWLGSQLKAAAAEDSEKPIFVFQHAHIFNTVYGSIGWGTPELTGVLSLYPQVIDFSGHSHFPINDPRAIYQQNFTAVNTGTLSYFELESGMDYGTVPPNASNAAQFHIVEVDADNRVRIMPFNILTGAFFSSPASDSDEQLIYYVDTPSDRSSFTYTCARYTNADRPVFPSDAQVDFSEVTANGATVTFTQAIDGECMNNYSVAVKNSLGITVKTLKFWSEFYFEPTPEAMSCTIEGLKPGTTYTVEITAFDTYAMSSVEPLKASFTTAAG